MDIAPRRVFVADGCSGALVAALITLVEPGEEVIPSPRSSSRRTARWFTSRAPQCRFAEVNDEHNLAAASVKRAMTPRTTAILINSPGNPFGNILSREELAELAALEIPIISDEVYTHLASTHERTPSVLDVSRDHFVAGSFSKTYAAAGLRLGFLVVPEKYIETIYAVRVTLNICPSLPSQRMGLALLRNHNEIVAEHHKYLLQHRAFFLKCAELHRLRSPRRAEERPVRSARRQRSRRASSARASSRWISPSE